ncbi:MAG: hypothetical protein ABEH89_00440 [bacterium]
MPPVKTVSTDEDSSGEWKAILQTSQHWEVKDAGNLLESENIPTVVEAEHFSGTYFEPFYQKHLLYVPEPQYEAALNRLKASPYEKFLLTYESDLEDVSDWRYRDVFLLLSGFLIGLVDWIVLYCLHFVDYVKKALVDSSSDKR